MVFSPLLRKQKQRQLPNNFPNTHFFLLLLQRSPRNVLAVLHAFEVYALDALVGLCYGFLERRRSRCGCDDATARCLERVVGEGSSGVE